MEPIRKGDIRRDRTADDAFVHYLFIMIGFLPPAIMMTRRPSSQQVASEAALAGVVPGLTFQIQDVRHLEFYMANYET